MTWHTLDETEVERLLQLGTNLPEPPLVDCPTCNDTGWHNANGPGIRTDRRGAAYANICRPCADIRRINRLAKENQQQKNAVEPPF